MNDDFFKTTFGSNGSFQNGNYGSGNNTNISQNAPNVQNTGAANSIGNNSGGGGGSSPEKPSIVSAIFHTLANNPVGQKVLVTAALLLIVYLIYALVLLPTLFEKPSKNGVNATELSYMEETRYRRKKPSFLQKLFCRGGKTSSFCSSDER